MMGRQAQFKPRSRLNVRVARGAFFIGRRREARAVQARLVTLTGAGGSGKTRLALHVATIWSRALPPAPGGAIWARSPTQPSYPQAVAAALGVTGTTGSPLAALTAAIGPIPRPTRTPEPSRTPEPTESPDSH